MTRAESAGPAGNFNIVHSDLVLYRGYMERKGKGKEKIKNKKYKRKIYLPESELQSSLGRLSEEMTGGGERSLRVKGPACCPAGRSVLVAGVFGV